MWPPRRAPLNYSIATPRPIDPAAASTNPSAQATQTLNPYLGSVPGNLVDGELKLTLNDAIQSGLGYNLGLIDSREAEAGIRADRERAFSALLPQITVRAEQSFQQVSLAEIGIKLPGIRLPGTTGGFGYSEGRVGVQFAAFDASLKDHYRARRADEAASALSTRDSRDVVVYAVGTAYFQVVASAARLSTAQAALASAQELATQTANELKAEVAPEIDSLQATVELHAAEQRVTDAQNDLEKDKLTLDRITGIPLDQKWSPAHEYAYAPLPGENPTQTRFDLASAKESVTAAGLDVKAAGAERMPSVSLDANYGTGGLNPGNYNQVYALSEQVFPVPLWYSPVDGFAPMFAPPKRTLRRSRLRSGTSKDASPMTYAWRGSMRGLPNRP